MEKQNLDLLFIPSPLMGHAGQLIELANLFVKTFSHITATILIMKLPGDPIGTGYTDSFTDQTRIKFIHFPPMDINLLQHCPTVGFKADAVINHHKPMIRELVASRVNGSGSGSGRINGSGWVNESGSGSGRVNGSGSGSGRVGALVVDMFCTPMIDVANEFDLATYVFFPSNAAFLGAMFYFQMLHDEHDVDIKELRHSGFELSVPSYVNPVPTSVVPNVIWDSDQWSKRFVRYTRKYREAKGIIVNTFRELERHALCSFDDNVNTPPVYTVGPLLKPLKPTPDDEVLKWLKSQPKESVVLLCFGSRGWFGSDQVREIAVGLERSGSRFIWSLRGPPSEELKGFPEEYTDFNKVLPDGFLERTREQGKVVGWVPQTEVLADVATGGFVSHCGWNSILENVWYGVPVATWPLYAKQQLDAFQMVKDLGLAVEISLDYNQLDKNQKLVSAETIEKGIRELMDGDSLVRAKVKEMKEKSRVATEEGGSSFTSLRKLVDDII